MILRYARIASQAHSSLLCIGAMNRPRDHYLDSIQQLEQAIEAWRMSFPDNGFRPRGEVAPQTVHGHVERQAVVFVHYMYASICLALSRATLHHLSAYVGESSVATRVQSALADISQASRSILVMTPFIQVEPCTNFWQVKSIALMSCQNRY